MLNLEDVHQVLKISIHHEALTLANEARATNGDTAVYQAVQRRAARLLILAGHLEAITRPKTTATQNTITECQSREPTDENRSEHRTPKRDQVIFRALPALDSKPIGD